jgi:hypothetical protein
MSMTRRHTTAYIHGGDAGGLMIQIPRSDNDQLADTLRIVNGRGFVELCRDILKKAGRKRLKSPAGVAPVKVSLRHGELLIVCPGADSTSDFCVGMPDPVAFISDCEMALATPTIKQVTIHDTGNA